METRRRGVQVDLGAGTAEDGSGGHDTLSGIENVSGSDHADTIAGDAHDNVLDGGAGDDVLHGQGGDDTLDGGDGSDTADYSDAAAAVQVDLQAGTAEDGGGGHDTLHDVENVSGSEHDDTIAGDAHDNVLDGGAGNDHLAGHGGDDTLHGGAGDDVLDGGAGSDTLDGGAGYDTADYSGADHALTVDLTDGTVTSDGDVDTLSGIEHVIGSEHDDTFAFSHPSDGGTYSIDGGGGHNSIDLSDYDPSDVTYNDGSLVVDMGEGHSFTIEHDNIDSIHFSDRTVNFATWDGGAGSDDFSDAANWSNDTVPGADDILVFDGTCVADAALDAASAGEFGHVLIEADYSGTITLEGDLNVGGDFVQNGGRLRRGGTSWISKEICRSTTAR